MDLEKQLDSVCSTRRNVMIMGNLNANFLNTRESGNMSHANNSTDHGANLSVYSGSSVSLISSVC